MIFNPIMTGGGGALPELTNPAERDEVVEGKEYIDKDGNKKVGNVYYPDIDYPVYLKPYEMDVTNGILTCRADVEVRTFLRPGHDIQIKYGDAGIDEGDASYLGDATPGDVSSNVEFSSVEGIGIKGSLVDGRGALARIPLDHDTTTVDTEPPWDPTIVKLYGTPKNEMIVGPNTKLYIETEGSYFGDAIAADVANGKTFTSAAGLKVTGTMTVPLIRYFNGRVDAQQAGGAVVFNIPVSLRGTGTIKIYGNINYGASATIAFSNNGSQNKAFANARSADASTAYSSALGQLSISYPTDLYGVSGGVDCNFVVIEI